MKNDTIWLMKENYENEHEKEVKEKRKLQNIL